MDRPKEGEIWQHRKHDPARGNLHQYKIICLTEPGHGPQDAPAYFTAIHTETGQWLDVMPAEGSAQSAPDDHRNWLFPPKNEPFVIYKAVHDDSGICWARPLDMFMDGRFSKL
jgi:hypothetical protein